MSRRKVRDFYIYKKCFGNGEERLCIVATKTEIHPFELGIKYSITRISSIFISVDGKEIKVKI